MYAHLREYVRTDCSARGVCFSGSEPRDSQNLPFKSINALPGSVSSSHRSPPRSPSIHPISSPQTLPPLLLMYSRTAYLTTVHSQQSSDFLSGSSELDGSNKYAGPLPWTIL